MSRTSPTHLINHYNCTVGLAYCYCFCLATLLPSRAKFNNLSFGMGTLLYVFGTYQYLGEFDPEMFMSTLISIAFFCFGNDVLKSRLQSLYTILIKSERLVQEKREVVETFPHSVLIIPKNLADSDLCYSNKEFDMKIKKLREDVESLKHISICNKAKDHGDRGGDSFTDLHNYLDERQKKFLSLNLKDTEAKSSLVIQCKDFEDG